MIPEKNVWHERPGFWAPRQRYAKALRRIYNVSPRDSERFAIKLLLLNKKGPTSFEDFRTVKGILYPTFVEASKAIGLLTSAHHKRLILREAADIHMPDQMRKIFAYLKTSYLIF